MRYAHLQREPIFERPLNERDPIMTLDRFVKRRVWALALICLQWSAGASAEQTADEGAALASAVTCAGDDRYERGLERLDQITQGQGRAVVDSLSDISPDLGRYIIEYPYGDVFCRSGLTDQQRQLATIAALAALGYTAPELRVHIHGALNVGLTEEEVVETMILMSVYAGFPASLHGLRAAREVFEARAQD